MDVCEAPDASWVSMVMERLHKVEKDNQDIRDELRDRSPSSIDESKLSYIPSTVVSTYVFCPVYLDTTDFCSLYNFAKSFVNSSSVFEAMFSWMFYDDVGVHSHDILKRPIMYISAVFWDIEPHKAFEIMSSVWKDVLVPSEVLARDLFEETDEPDRVVQMSSYITDTAFFDVWSHLIGHARSAIYIRHDGYIMKSREYLMSIRVNEDHLMSVRENEDRQTFMAQFISACAMDRVIMHDPQSLKRKDELFKRAYPSLT